MILPKSFYNRKTLQVAQDLLGCFLVRKFEAGSQGVRHPIGCRTPFLRCKIVETEAYCGPWDLASHASRGRTKRNEIMFGEPGIVYIYLIYGMYHMLNIVTEKKDYPAAVLIRAVEGVINSSLLRRGRRGRGEKENVSDPALTLPLLRGGNFSLKTNGPGKLTKTLRIDKSFNGLPVYRREGLWIEGRKDNIKNSQIKKTPRIGVDYSREYKDKPWRFYLKDSKLVSKK